jgi:Protein of unknown function (DUF2934)
MKEKSRWNETSVTPRTIGCNRPLTRIGYHSCGRKDTDRGSAVDIETRRKKQQALMVQLVERKVRSRAKQLYETRGQEEGQALQDWVQAESEVLGNSILAPLYRRLRTGSHDVQTNNSAEDFATQEAGSESNA